MESCPVINDVDFYCEHGCRSQHFTLLQPIININKEHGKQRNKHPTNLFFN
jgi:hypothetical protein